LEVNTRQTGNRRQKVKTHTFYTTYELLIKIIIDEIPQKRCRHSLYSQWEKSLSCRSQKSLGQRAAMQGHEEKITL